MLMVILLELILLLLGLDESLLRRVICVAVAATVVLRSACRGGRR